MKAKRILFGVLLFAIALGAFASESIGAEAWYYCKVVASGPGAGATEVYIKLTETSTPAAFTNKWFRAGTGRENAMLAAALTAMSAGATVQVYVDASLSYPRIANLYMVAP